MFDDARFYNRLAEDSESYGMVSSSQNAMLLIVGELDCEDDLLAAIDKADDYLLDEAS